MNLLYKVAIKCFHILGYHHPSRINQRLDKLAQLIVQIKHPSKHRKKEAFLLKKKLYTHFYGYQIKKNAKSIGKEFYVGGPSFCNSNTIIKDHVCFNGMQIDGNGEVTIGSYFHSGRECMMITSNHDYDTGSMIPYGIKDNSKPIEISDYVWLGRRVTILPGTRIGEGAIIQAGAVVHGEIPPYAIAGGNPAKVFRYRNIEHFEKLKSMNLGMTNDLFCKLYFEQ
ncbi:MAG: acyltransferase [Bacteroidales bacterium]|nr:acyltransferase [Bacteroidales bacterium]